MSGLFRGLRLSVLDCSFTASKVSIRRGNALNAEVRGGWTVARVVYM